MVKDKPIDQNEVRIEKDVSTLIDTDRVINFSDAIFAFSATLLIIKIDLPNIPPEVIQTHFFIELFKLIPAYLANFVSFLIIAYYWRCHHKLFVLIKRFDNTLIWLNVFTLIFVAFLPFPIDLFGQYSAIPDVVVFYTLSLVIVGVMLLILWIYASHKHRLIDRGMTQKTIMYHTLSTAIAPFVFALSIPLVYIDPVLAKISWVFVLILLWVLNSHYKISQVKNPKFNPEPE